MRFALAAAFVLLPGLALAERSPLSAEIAASGIAATEARLAALPDPSAPDLFALAGLRFLSGVEQALQLRWQTGVQADWSELPILRLPIPENPAARPFTGADLTALLTGLSADMEASRAALDALGDRDFVLEIALADLWFDIDRNGTRSEGEGIGDVALNALGDRRAFGVSVIDPVIRFDTADAAWLSAYTHFLQAFADLAQAYDPAPSVDRIAASAQAMKDLWGPTPPSNAYDMMFGRQVDRVAIILQALAQQPDPARTRSSLAHLRAMIAENRRFWTLVRAETDNAGEWVPNDAQVSALGLNVPPGTGDRWLAVLDEADRMLAGDLLVPHWRFGADAGINVAKLFENPPAIDLVALVQGEGFLPYAQKGSLVTLAAWRDFESLVQGDSMLFAVFLN